MSKRDEVIKEIVALCEEQSNGWVSIAVAAAKFGDIQIASFASDRATEATQNKLAAKDMVGAERN